MTWLDHQYRSKKFAAAARTSAIHGDETKSLELYVKAAQEAEQAMSQVPREKQVTLGVIAMFASALWRRAHRTDDAARLAKLVGDARELLPNTVTPGTATDTAPTRAKYG